MRRAVGLSLALALCPLAASAGQRPYAYVQGAESLPQTGLELESWFGATRDVGAAASSWDWWLGPVVGVTDRLELALYGIFLQDPGSSLKLGSLRWQGSYLLADRGSWPVDVRVRLEVGQPVSGHSYSTWLWVIASRDFGKFNVTGNLSFWLSLPTDGGEVGKFLDYLGGVSYQVYPGVRAGAELVGGSYLDGGPGSTAVSLGPSLSAGTGRVWAAASYDFGLTNASTRQGRIVLGLAF